jgi:hypothetical protein
MKTSITPHSLRASLAAVVLAPFLVPTLSSAADQPVEMPAYQVTAPRFTSPTAEFMEKMDTLFDSPWIDAQGGPLIQDIIWRHAYLSEHPSDEAIIYVDRSADGRVTNATTVYTKNGALYANSYALGSNVKLHGLTAADLHDTTKVLRAIGGIYDAYLLDASTEDAQFRALGDLNFIRPEGPARGRLDYFISTFQPVAGDFAIAGGGYGSPHTQDLYAFAEFEGNTGQVVPYGLNPFYPGFMDAGWSDRYHEPPAEMLDTVSRAMHDPDRAGLIPVAVSPVNFQMRSRRGPVLRSTPALVFDWDGVHYVYRPYRGTIGHPIPLNPVTGLPYLCVKDGGLIESIYFSATYLKGHPAEKAVVVPSDTPAAAYTVNGKLCLFSPSLNEFVLLKASGPEAIGDQTVLHSSIARAKAVLAARPAPAATTRPARPGRLPDRLLGDTADSQMRRIFVAFQQAGIPVHLNSGDISSLTFSWQGVNYVYGADQQLRQNSSG